MYTISEQIPPVCRRIQALAERDPRRAVPLAQRHLEACPADSSHAGTWPSYTLGWALLCWERFDEARLHLRAAREAFIAVDQHLAILYCDFALMLADLFQLARPELEQDLSALADQFEQAGAPSEAACAWVYLAGLLNVLGRPRDAEAILDRIEPAMAQYEPLDQARALYIRGAAAILRHDYARADDLLAQAEQRFTALHSPLERAKCWFQQAWSALEQKKLDLALTEYRHAEDIFARLDLPIRLAFSAKNIGLLLTRMGKYNDALPALLRALQSFTAVQRIADIGGCQLNLGNVYFYIGQWNTALTCYTQAETLYTTANVVGERIIARRNRAMVYRTIGQLDTAHALLVEVEAEAQAAGNQKELAATWVELAGLLDNEGRYEEAALQYQRASDLFSRLGILLNAADCIMEHGWMELRRGESSTAYQLFSSAVPLIADYPHGRWRTEFGLALCAEARGDVPAALSHYRAALAIVARLRQSLASETVSSSVFAQAEQLHSASLRFAATSGALDDLLVFSEWQRALVLQRLIATGLTDLPATYQKTIEATQRRIAVLLDEAQGASMIDKVALGEALADYSDLLLRGRSSTGATTDSLQVASESRFDLAQLRAQLNHAYNGDWTALVYMVNGDTLLISVVTPDDLMLAQTPCDARFQLQIKRAGQATYQQLATSRGVPSLQARTAMSWNGLRALADRLIPAAARERLHPAHRLLIVPSGLLHTLPWAALRLEENWLVERAIVQLLPSLTVWQSLAARPASHNASALLIGCSTFGTRAADLPAITKELTSVAAHWPGDHRRLDDAQATPAALIELSSSGELAGYGLLHIASHAQLLPLHGLAAHLKLWEDDLWLPEVAGLRLGGALVVLSACEGALADTLPGEEVLSLSWAFLAAGASGVLASLWPVYDQAAYHFMDLFYHGLRQLGDAALALAQAQRTLIVRGQLNDDPLAEPLYWGSFVLIGGCHRLW